MSDSDYELIPGGIKLKVNAGSPGDHTIEGNLVFLSEGNESKISVNQTYSVISKPNSAVISADKMNVVYRGVQNPITISIPGIQDSKINASAPGLKRLKGVSIIFSQEKVERLKLMFLGPYPMVIKFLQSQVLELKIFQNLLVISEVNPVHLPYQNLV